MSVRKFRFQSQMHDGVNNVEVMAGWEPEMGELYLRVYRIMPDGKTIERIWDSEGMVLNINAVVSIAFGFCNKIPQGWLDALKADAAGKPLDFVVTSYRLE